LRRRQQRSGLTTNYNSEVIPTQSKIPVRANKITQSTRDIDLHSYQEYDKFNDPHLRKYLQK
jgi:hypothetical protein